MGVGGRVRTYHVFALLELKRLLSSGSEAISIHFFALNSEIFSEPYDFPRPGELALNTISYVSSGHPVTETSNILVQQEHPLRDLQNDIHHMADSLPGLWKALASNLTAAMTEANQTELGECQAPWAEVEPDRAQEDEWEGSQEGPNLRGPPL